MSRKKTEAELLADQGIAVRTFINGPWNGKRFRMSLYAPPFIRFAFPTWCTYEWDPDQGYVYWGTEPPPHQELESSGPAPRPLEPYIPDPEPYELYHGSEAYQRGVALASEVVA